METRRVASQYVITLQMQHNCMQYSDVDHILSVSATILQWAIIGKIILLYSISKILSYQCKFFDFLIIEATNKIALFSRI